jgi:DNA-binding CsgD family transcriptional regulator
MPPVIAGKNSCRRDSTADRPPPHDTGCMTAGGTARATSPRLVGRDDELEALGEFAAALRDRQPHVALIRGRAGMGKTRLVTEAAVRWRAGGVQVLIGGCVPVEGQPYAPLVTAMRPALASNAPLFRMLVAGQAPTRSELLDALAFCLTSLAERSPLVLVVEDLHWSDRATRDALAYLVTQVDVGRWGLVATYRYEGPLPQTELVSFADVLERRPIMRLTLGPLSVSQVAEQVAEIVGEVPTSEEAAAVHRRSGGIPLLVEEVIAAGGSGVPDHLRSLFLAHLQEHGSNMIEILRVIAIAETCDEFVVAGTLGLDARPISLVLRQACDADLLVVDKAGYRFRHDLLREAVYDDIAPGRRRELHGRVAALLASRADADAAVLAGHWYLAGERERAALASFAAAEQAERMHAPAAAKVHYERILAAWPRLGDSIRQRCGPWDELLRRVAYVAERSGDFARAVNLTAERITAAEGTSADQALRWERLARYRWEAGDGHGSRAAYKEAVRVLPSNAPLAVRAMVLSGFAWHLAATFHFDEAKPWAAEGLTACRGVDDQAVRWQVYLAQGIAWLGTTAGHEALEESCRLATAVGSADWVSFSRIWLNVSIQHLGYSTDREPNLRIALRAAAADGLGSSTEAALRYMLAEYLCEIGRWDEAAAELELNLRRLRVTGIPALFSWGYEARLAAWRGDSATAQHALQRTRSLTELAPQQPVPLISGLVGWADRLLWGGQLEAAVAAAREAVALGSVSGYDAAEPLAVLCRAEADIAEGTRRQGGKPEASVRRDLTNRLGEIKREPAPRAAAFAATCDAELSRWSGERNPVPWWHALQAWQEAGDPYREAYARWRLAWAHVADRSGRAEAATHLAWAADVAARLGARPLGDTVARSAVRWRLPLSGARSDNSLAAALSARELEVLALLAAGRSNAEIADILVISPRTVGTHVSRILHKLGADRRAQVADLARRVGLLDE